MSLNMQYKFHTSIPSPSQVGREYMPGPSYVLALVFLDFVCVLFVLPLLFVVNIAERNPFTIALKRTRNEV